MLANPHEYGKIVSGTRAIGTDVESLGGVDAVVLAGGLGTRLRSVMPDRPKVLADVAGRPFLTYVLDRVATQGVRRVILSTGHLGEQVEAVLGGDYGCLSLAYSRESEPLGTGGALRLAAPLISSEDALVLNGDSLCFAPLCPVLEAHRSRGAAVTILVSRVADGERYGTVEFDEGSRVTRFVEKGHRGPSWANAGVYVLKRQLIESIPAGRPVSLERDLLPDWIGPNTYAYASRYPFMDIGLPRSLRLARRAAADGGLLS